MAAASFVVSDAVAVLWTSTWERHGFEVFAQTAAPQLIRWESEYGEGLSRRPRGSDATQRAGDLAEWHGLLLDNLVDVEGGPLDKIAGHDALGGPEQTFFAARLAHRRGDNAVARSLVARCLQKLPGHSQFRELATELEV